MLIAIVCIIAFLVLGIWLVVLVLRSSDGVIAKGLQSLISLSLSLYGIYLIIKATTKAIF